MSRPRLLAASGWLEVGRQRLTENHVIDFHGRGILLDIEGTTSSVSFVYDVMFPFIHREIAAYLRNHWGEPNLAEACDAIARDAGKYSLADWCAACQPAVTSRAGVQALVETEALRLMDGDVKATGLKLLQGLVWEAGFQSGELQAHVFDDVPPALSAWNKAKIDVRIYSSGSVHAQQLFFGHSVAGNLLKKFHGHYDTTIGPKKEAGSYRKIAAAFPLPPKEILFISDIAAELDAAAAAGLQTALTLRPGNTPQPPGHAHRALHSFAEIHLV